MSKEIKVKKTILTKSDFEGNMIYGNPEFERVTGYKTMGYINKSHNIIRHPDMPEIVFKMLWKELSDGNDFICIIKNKTKDYNFYWVDAKLKIELGKDGLPFAYSSTNNPLSKHARTKAEELFENILEIEKEEGIEASSIYLDAFLNVRKLTFQEYMQELIDHKGGLFGMFKK